MRFDDSDMKIVPDKPSDIFDMSEGAASAFVREKSNGNMDKAHQLGLAFAAEILNPTDAVVLFGIGQLDTELTIMQRKLMFAYIVNKVIEEMAPNSIVAQSAMAAFYDEIGGHSPEIYELITDSAAFSLYILSVRSSAEEDDPYAIGRVFAQLCEHEDDKVFINYGCELAKLFTIQCTQMVLKADMIR